MKDEKDNYKLYMETAEEMLVIADENFSNKHYRAACNRAYYGIFYAASALLFSKGKSYGKHSAVIAAFRQHFIKTGEFDKKWSDDYRVIMENRHIADYELQEDLDKEDALMAIEKSKEFIEEVKK
jgi:hypothetical protein